jgi:hypothetical protein
MTPKEKAEELVIKMNIKYKCTRIDTYITINTAENPYAKECALIAVEEILGDIDDSIFHPQNKEAIDYWQEVKQEIENL